MPKDVSAELNRGNRLSPSFLNKMMRWIVMAMMDGCPKPLWRESALKCSKANRAKVQRVIERSPEWGCSW